MKITHEMRSSANNCRLQKPIIEDNTYSLNIATHSSWDRKQKNTEEEQAIRSIVDGIELLDDISEWFGLTNKQQHELLSNDMIGLIPNTHGTCFGFKIQKGELEQDIEDLYPQLLHALNGNKDTYLYSVLHYMEYESFWDMFDYDPDEFHGTDQDLPWTKEMETIYETSNILWAFNKKNDGAIKLGCDHVEKCIRIYRGDWSPERYHFEVNKSNYDLINTNKSNVANELIYELI